MDWVKARFGLVENWKSAWKWISMNCMAAALAVLGAWGALPESMQATISPEMLKWIAMGLLVAGMVGRLVKQDGTQ